MRPRLFVLLVGALVGCGGARPPGPADGPGPGPGDAGSPPTTIEVAGRVVGATGVPLSGVTVTIAGTAVLTGDDGRFLVPGVVPPYDVDLSAGATPRSSGRFEGLTRADPTLVFLWLFSSGEPNTATISGTVHGGDPVGGPGEFTVTFFTTRDVRFDFTAIGLRESEDFTLPVSWFGPPSITATLHVLQFRSPGSSQPPTDYVGHGTRAGLALSRGDTLTGADVTLTSPGTTTVAGPVSAPPGFSVTDRSLGLELDGTTVPLGHVSGPANGFSFAVPASLDATGAVSVTAVGSDGSLTTARRSGLAPGTTDGTIVMPDPARPLAPADGARDVAPGTELTWTPLPGAVHVAVLQTSTLERYVVTAGRGVRLPDVPSGTFVTWTVVALGPHADLDAFTGGPNFFPTRGDTFQTASAPRGLTVR